MNENREHAARDSALDPKSSLEKAVQILAAALNYPPFMIWRDDAGEARFFQEEHAAICHHLASSAPKSLQSTHLVQFVQSLGCAVEKEVNHDSRLRRYPFLHQRQRKHYQWDCHAAIMQGWLRAMSIADIAVLHKQWHTLLHGMGISSLAKRNAVGYGCVTPQQAYFAGQIARQGIGGQILQHLFDIALDTPPSADILAIEKGICGVGLPNDIFYF